MTLLWDYLVHQAQTNQFFTGAALGGAALAALNYGRQAALHLMRLVVRRLTVSATLHSEDDMYVPLSRWLAKNRFDAFAQQYRVRTAWNGERPGLSDTSVPAGGHDSQGSTAEAVFGPAYGSYTFRHAKKWLRVSVSREGDAAGQGSSRAAQTREFLTISYLGLSRSLLQRIMDEALDAVAAERQTSLSCCVATMHGWMHSGSLRRAGPATCPVVLEAGLLDEIEADIEGWLQRRDWYDQRGIPWRRGYLLHGPPGTGKTSLCRHLARRFGLNIYVVDAGGYMGDLGSMLQGVQPRSLVLFEDIDCHDISKRQEQAAQPGVSQNGDVLMRMNIGTLLNAIDGVNPPEQLLIVMTSNNPAVLDPALLRPGRIDRKIFLGRCSSDHAAKLLLKFFPGLAQEDVAQFRSAVRDDAYSPADLQEIFITEDNFDAVMARVLAGVAPEPMPLLEHGGRHMTLGECVEAEGG